MLKILKRGFYSLPLVPLIYNGMIYSLTYLYLMNIRLLMSINTIESHPETLMRTHTLLFTGCTVALICLRSIF
jgi:hypothetical protein